MFRIDVSTAATSFPTPASPGPNPDSYFTNGTLITHDWLNAVQEEIAYVITTSGGVLSKTDRTQLYTAFQALITAYGGLKHVSDDPSPVLGGDLNMNGHNITSTLAFTITSPYAITINTPTLLVNNEIQSYDGTFTWAFGSSSMSMSIGASIIFDMTTSGIRVGNTGARIGFIDDDTGLTNNSSTESPTQHAVKTYVDTKVASQTNKAVQYVDMYTDTSITAGNTYYFARAASTTSVAGGSTATYVYCWIAPVNGTITNYTLYASTDTGSGHSLSIDLYKNGSTASATSTISGSSGGTSYGPATWTGTISVTAGDAVCFKVTSSAGATTVIRMMGWFIFTPS